MSKLPAPRTTEAATRLLEQYAELQGQIDVIQANRATSIADVNARCDTAANDLIAKRAEILEAIEPWWTKAGSKLLTGKRKSIELGGCMLGSRTGRDSLAVDGDEQAIIASLKRRKWAAGLLRVVWSLDKVAIKSALTGDRRKQLASLGLSVRPAPETFYIERAEQAGTLAGA
jgi:phage host-nuclease inhibitor protein Gam